MSQNNDRLEQSSTSPSIESSDPSKVIRKIDILIVLVCCAITLFIALHSGKLLSTKPWQPLGNQGPHSDNSLLTQDLIGNAILGFGPAGIVLFVFEVLRKRSSRVGWGLVLWSIEGWLVLYCILKILGHEGVGINRRRYHANGDGDIALFMIEGCLILGSWLVIVVHAIKPETVRSLADRVAPYVVCALIWIQVYALVMSSPPL